MNQNKSGWQRVVIGIGGFVVVLGGLYCLVGVLQATWLSATPGYPLERAKFNLNLWGGGCVAFLLLAIVLGILLLKSRERR